MNTMYMYFELVTTLIIELFSEDSVCIFISLVLL